MCAAAWPDATPDGRSGEGRSGEARGDGLAERQRRGEAGALDAEEIDEARDAVGLRPVDGEVGGPPALGRELGGIPV